MCNFIFIRYKSLNEDIFKNNNKSELPNIDKLLLESEKLDVFDKEVNFL